jgi:hypothetical protein
MSLDFYDKLGYPFAYLDDNDSIYTFTGIPTAYIEDDSIYNFDGRHIGYFQNGAIFDSQGSTVLFSDMTIGGPVKPAKQMIPMKAMKQMYPMKSLKEMKPMKPTLTFTWSQYSPQELFGLGK